MKPVMSECPRAAVATTQVDLSAIVRTLEVLVLFYN